MSQKNFTTKLLGMEGAKIKEFTETETEIRIGIEMNLKKHTCPECGKRTKAIHDYRICRITDLSVRGKHLRLEYRKRRYRCAGCGKRFAERCSFVGKYQRFTYRVAQKIIELLHTRLSAKDIARETGTSGSGVHRCLKLVNRGRPSRLPTVLALDEFKGNAGGERFQCILTAPAEKRVLDILPDRTVSTIQSYLKGFPNRDEVEYVIMDMNRGYRDIAQSFFPTAKIVIDRFHVVRYVTKAPDDVRRRIQKHLLPETRKYFKRSRRLLLIHESKLKPEERIALNRMLAFSEDLSKAYALKEAFYTMMEAKSSEAASLLLKKWLDVDFILKIPEFKPCSRMLRNWKPYILNMFDVPYSNGFTEGCNNSVKTLKRIAFGFRNFHHFRARILLAASPSPQHLT